MKALVVYESMFGNTEALARAIADRLHDAFEVTLRDVREMPPADGVDLLVVGGPTHAFGLSRPSTRADAERYGAIRTGATAAGLREYLGSSPTLTGIAAAAFDTRVAKAWSGSAARRTHRQLHRLGCRMPVPAQSFVVKGMTGPLLDDEVQRAEEWATRLAALMLTARHHV